MKDQLVQVIFHEYGKGIGEYGNIYRVDSFGELIRVMARDLKPDWYAVATWINSIGESFEVFVDDESVTLTYKEYELLRKLMKYKKTVLTRDRLLEEIWGYEFTGETRTVDVHIRTLRQKLGSAGDLIETVRGVGYRIGGTYGE